MHHHGHKRAHPPSDSKSSFMHDDYPFFCTHFFARLIVHGYRHVHVAQPHSHYNRFYWSWAAYRATPSCSRALPHHHHRLKLKVLDVPLINNSTTKPSQEIQQALVIITIILQLPLSKRSNSSSRLALCQVRSIQFGMWFIRRYFTGQSCMVHSLLIQSYINFSQVPLQQRQHSQTNPRSFRLCDKPPHTLKRLFKPKVFQFTPNRKKFRTL